MINNVDAQRFALLFKGKTDTYVRNELPKEKSADGQKIKTKITNNEGKVDKDLLARHLDGDFGVGICPVNAEGKCFFGVLDIDYYGAELSRVLHIISEYSLPLIPFRSKSGGLHIYMFLAKSVSAKTVRDLLGKIIYTFSLEELYGKGKVEIFPKQEKAEGFGSAITLPYFNAENPYTYMLDAYGKAVDFSSALEYIQKHLTSVEAIETSLDNLPYNDAPPCIQRILLSHLVGSDDSGRNNFLFSFAIYAKKKYGSGFEDYVKAVNADFECPLEDSIVEEICASVANHEYIYKCKDIPCHAYCNRAVCKKREFGLGRDKSHFTGIDYGQLFRYKSAEPYYVWKLRLHGQENWVDVIFKDEGFLLDQKNFAKMCVRYLNQAPMQVSANDWYTILNSVLPNIQDIEVKAETDTSATSMLKNAFISYLANKQARRDCPYQIKVGLCVRQSVKGEAKYYFTHRGFSKYLCSQKINFDLATFRETLKSFGAVEDSLTYTNSIGDTINYPCWSKAEDNEISDMYEGVLEVENGDKQSTGITSVSEATNVEETETIEKDKPYTEEDLKDAESMF